MMTNHPPSAPNQLSETPSDDWLDISAGAAHFCLRQPVQIHRQIVSDYVEADATLGLNVIGAIRPRLVWRSTRSGDESCGVIAVALRRRADREPVEVFLEVHSVRRNDQELLRLQFAGEQKSGSGSEFRPLAPPTQCSASGG